MNIDLIGPLVRKDLTLFGRNRFYAFISVLGLVVYVGLFYLMPAVVDEDLELGIVASELPATVRQALADEEGLRVIEKDSEDAMRDAMLAGDFDAGLVFPAGWMQQLAEGETPQIKILLTTDVPAEFEDLYEVVVKELTFTALGRQLDVESEEVVLGPDLAGAQIPPRERLLPLLAVVVLMLETMGLASLIASEIQERTIRALLVTPLRVEGLFLAKGTTGVFFTFVQVALLMGVTGGYSQNAGIVLLALLLGSVLVTGIGFMIASVARDMMSVMAWGMLALIVLVIPAFGLMVPGSVTGWGRIIPSHYVIDTIYRAANFDVGWGDVAGNLAILLAFSAGILVLGVVTLRRRFQ